jgi:hypothetical protein
MSASVWSLHAPAASLKSSSSTVALQMGAAVNFMRAAQRWYLATVDDATPAGLRDGVCAFLVSSAYLKEAVDSVLRPQYQLIVQLARQGGAQDELITRIGDLASKKPNSLYSRLLMRLRNQLVFHFDAEPLQQWADQNTNQDVIWAEGTGELDGQVSWVASADASLDVFNRLSPDEVNKRIKEVADFSGDLVLLFQSAISAFIKQNGGTVNEPNPGEA